MFVSYYLNLRFSGAKENKLFLLVLELLTLCTAEESANSDSASVTVNFLTSLSLHWRRGSLPSTSARAILFSPLGGLACGRASNKSPSKTGAGVDFG